jgi:hypothetical protein
MSTAEKSVSAGGPPRLLVAWTHVDTPGMADRLLEHELARWCGTSPGLLYAGRRCP